MMKRALLSHVEPSRVCDVVDVGNEFETSPELYWVDCPDEVDSTWSFDLETQEFKPWDPLTQPGFAENAYKVARQIAYLSTGDQLDMLYKELQATGTISSTGPWATHIQSVKATIPKDDPAAVLEWNRQLVAAMEANANPQ